nr:hypothetical protein CFP56_45840 [Quercus suber]
MFCTRVIARKLYVNVSWLKVQHELFCTDAATRVSGSNCGQPSPWNPRIAIVLVFPMETSRLQSPVSPN